METVSVREASARVIAALRAAGRSRTTIKRHQAELNAFARFLQARGQNIPTEEDCLDFVGERSGCRLAGSRKPANPVSYTHLRAHETDSYLVCRLLLEKK